MDDIPYGYCHCGCGGLTPVLDRDVRSQGYTRGDHRRFIKGHANRTRNTRTVLERFEEKIDRSGECWVWTANRTAFGYGRFALPGHRTVFAHRYAYELWVGSIPDGLLVLHGCDNPPCVNPTHLHLGTYMDNNHECAARGRNAKGAKSAAYTRPESVMRGERHPAAVLTEAQVRSIYASIQGGASQASVAREHGTTPTAIWCIVHRRSWKHLDL